MMKKMILVFVLSAFLLVSCGLLPGNNRDPLDGTSWNLRYIRKTTPLADSAITIQFDDGRVGGSAGCNSYFGDYALRGDQIEIGPIAMTEMACIQEGVMEQEQEYLAFLSEVVSFSMEDDQLLLKKAQQDQLTFEK